MVANKIHPVRIDRQLVGPAVTIGGQVVQMTARLMGWSAGETRASSDWGGALVKLVPVEAVVRRADGSEHRVTMSDPTGQSLRGMASIAAVVAAGCSVLILIARLTRVAKVMVCVL